MGATKTLLELLRRHYIKPGVPFPGGVFIPECGINGGTGGSRADALYVGFTSTSGRILVGHELKTSRSDWRRELDQVGKADVWADNCHQWYVVAPGPDVVPQDEVPHGWGLMYPSTRTKTRMQVVVKPTMYAERQPSWVAVRSIFARLDTLRAQHDAQVKQQAHDQMRREVAEQVSAELERRGKQTMAPEDRQRLDVLARLEELVGTPIDNFVWRDEGPERVSAETVAAALRLVLSTKDLGLDRVQRYQADGLRQAGEQLLAGLAAFTEAREQLLALTAVNA